MKRNNLKKDIVYCCIAVLVFSTIYMGVTFNNTNNSVSSLIPEQYGEMKSDFNLEPKASSTTNNYETIESVFTQKSVDYSQLGYFPQYYEPSLQATYYALYILEAVGELDQINQTSVLDYILSHYDEETHIFIDKYAYRYLDSIFPYLYYPYTSVLQVNCYALLSLDILGNLNMIDKQDSIDFIWSCFNPEGTENGFIGQPYSTSLSSGFKTATMDNSFYAITTLDLLMDDWSGYSSERTKLVNFINGLQEDSSSHDSYGGFYNDHNMSINSLAISNEVNLLASYYNLKSLSAFDLVETIQTSSFHQYLTNLYDNIVYSFQIFDDGDNKLNLVATALGLELANITGFIGMDKDEVINFIISNRNAVGNWDASTQYDYHELIDTFQIVRCLKELELINQLSSQEKSEIANSMSMYCQFEGYSLLSHDYMSLKLIHSIVKSFSLFDRISDLDISGLFNMLTTNYKGDLGIYGFLASTNMNQEYIRFRSRPIEYYSYGQHTYTNVTDSMFSHKFTYMALDSLLQMYKLDDFEAQYGLMDIYNQIIDCQYLEYNYENFGAFVLFRRFGPPEYQNNFIFFEYSYYAIKTLELINNYLDLGGFVNLSFNQVALHGYIERNIIETDTTLYFDPQFTSDADITLKYTYYMIYILKALNLFNLNTNKITQFVLENMDYGNILKIYYCYKISEILDLNIDFDLIATQNLVKSIFSDDFHEFFISSDFKELDQEAFLWVCDLAMNSEFEVNCDYEDSILLGDINTITTSFYNMIYADFGSDITVKFESPTLGTFELDRQFNTTFQINLMVPEEPENFPHINGSLKIYKNSKVIGETPVFFYTNINYVINNSYKKDNNKIRLEVNISRAFYSGYQPVASSQVQADVFRNNIYIETLNFSKYDFADYSKFTLYNEINGSGTYTYNASLFDEFYPSGCCLFTIQHIVSPPPPPPPEINGPILAIIGLVGSITVVGVTANVGNRVKKRRSKKIIEPEQKSSAREIIEDVEKALYDNWED